MKVAVPVWNGHVSPVLDTANTLQVVTVDEGSISARENVPLENPFVSARADQVRRLGVDVLICGALSRPLCMMIESAGAQVFAWVSGDVDDVINAWISGDISERFAAPGVGGRRLRRRHRGGRGGRSHGSW
jgi:predicted Fe-Mo cluster-binding NifX family protein